MRVIGYARCSTSEQASEGVTLDAQRAKMRMYATLHDLDLVAVEVDAGISAKTLDRPGLVAALGRLDAGDADGLLIAKLDRLSRSVADWNDLIERYFGPTAGKQLFSVADSIDTRTAAGRMVLNIMMTVAQWERETIAERTRDALHHKRGKNERIGTIPLGSRLADDGRKLEPAPEEMATIQLIHDLADGGMTYRGIARELDARGIPPKLARTWNHVTILKLLRTRRSG